MEKLIFQSVPIVTLATNKFINVPIIFQYEDTPLIQIIKEAELGYTTSIPIYHTDGTYLAKVNGTRVFPTEAGKKAGIVMRHPVNKTVCEMEGKTLFEIHHETGDAFKAFAELHTPDGYFVKIQDSPQPGLLNAQGNAIQIGGIIMSECTFQGVRIGIWLRKDGSCAIGCS